MHVGLPGCTGHGMRVSPMSWTGVSSTCTTERRGSGASLYRSSTSSMRATYSASTQGIHHILRCQGLRACSASAGAPSHMRPPHGRCAGGPRQPVNSRVQRARPDGGSEHVTATSKVTWRPLSFRFAPSRGSSFNAAFRHPSTKRRLTRYTVEIPTLHRGRYRRVATALVSGQENLCAFDPAHPRLCPLRVNSCNCV